MKPACTRWFLGSMVVGAAFPIIALLFGDVHDPEISIAGFSARDNAAWALITIIAGLLSGIVGAGTAGFLTYLRGKKEK